jgi:hypothetical protein
MGNSCVARRGSPVGMTRVCRVGDRCEKGLKMTEPDSRSDSRGPWLWLPTRARERRPRPPLRASEGASGLLVPLPNECYPGDDSTRQVDAGGVTYTCP